MPFRLDDVRHGRPPVTLAARPGQPVILNFLASWCDPCHEELPLLAALQRRDAGRLQVIGVDVQDNQALATQLLAGAGVEFPVGYDPNRTVSEAWTVIGLPITVFVAADGTVVTYHRGQLQAPELGRLAQHLLITGAPSQHRQS